MSTDNKLISVVIPIKNGEKWIDACITGIMAQTLFADTEIIVVDSGSDDKTLDILKNYPVQVFQIQAQDFNHGLTRNFGVSKSKGRYIVMTVQDARPTDNLWLQKLLNGFDAADNVAAVCGQQVVPHDKDKNPVDWFRPKSDPKPIVYSLSQAAFDMLSPTEKKGVCGWDDVTAMYKKEVIEALPFRKTSFAEDAQWAKDALLSGYTIVYNYAARVYHYHFENPTYTYNRTFTVLYHMYKFFGYLPELHTQSLINNLRLAKLLLNEKSLSFSEKWKWYNYNKTINTNIQQAVADFLSTVKDGDTALEEKHEILCGTPPTAPVQ